PRTLSHSELRNVSRRFISAISAQIGPDVDIPAPDVGTNAQTMAWFADTYLNITQGLVGNDSMAVVTGKPLEMGGSLGREKATGQGVIDVLAELLPEIGLTIAEASCSLIGYGNVGSWAGKLFAERGGKIKAVMDHTGAVYNEGGLDALALDEHVRIHGGVAGFEQAGHGAEAITEEQFYAVPVDVFIPAALEQMITADKAELIDCKIVAEAANAPTTPAGENILLNKGIEVLPAILCSAGGVTVSYFEWVQNRSNQYWDAEKVDEELNRHMVLAARRTQLAKHRYDVDMRTAAYIGALEQIASVYKLRGIFP
ncbi:MAG: Glu/Leu/Phe/Val dehydrogenase, partial [Planctomycetota bacterium]